MFTRVQMIPSTSPMLDMELKDLEIVLLCIVTVLFWSLLLMFLSIQYLDY